MGFEHIESLRISPLVHPPLWFFALTNIRRIAANLHEDTRDVGDRIGLLIQDSPLIKVLIVLPVPCTWTPEWKEKRSSVGNKRKNPIMCGVMVSTEAWKVFVWLWFC